MHQEKLRQFAQGDLRLNDLRLFYYLLGNLQKKNVVNDFSGPMVAKELGYTRSTIWLARNNLIDLNVLVIKEAEDGPDTLEISKIAIGMRKTA